MALFCCCCCNNTSFLWWLTTTTFASASLHWNALWVDSRIMGYVVDFLCCFEWSTSWVGKICKKNNLFNYQSKISCFFQIPSSFFPMLGSVLSIWDFLGTYIIIVFFSLKNLILFISVSVGCWIFFFPIKKVNFWNQKFENILQFPAFLL